MPAKKADNGPPWLQITLAIIALIGALGAAWIASRPPAPPPQVPPSTAAKKLLTRLDFNYADSPTKYGWQLLDTTPVTFTYDKDGYVGNHVIIQSDGFYGMETVSAQRFRVDPASLMLHSTCHNRV